jgi:formylglycine-generating enzyme required for sulfatase activity
MPEKVLFVLLILLSAMCVLSACGQKDKGVSETEGETVPEPATPAIVPGEMALIPAGEFIMGTNNKGHVAYPEHKVNLPAFWIDKYEPPVPGFAIKASYTGEAPREGLEAFTPKGLVSCSVYYLKTMRARTAMGGDSDRGRMKSRQRNRRKAASWGNDREKRANTL